jgi:HK97 family phage major capsid protein
MTSKEMRERRAKVAEEIKKMADLADTLARDEKEPRDFNPEEQEKWEKINADYDAQSRQIEIAERSEKIAAEQAEIVSDPIIGRAAPDNGREKAAEKGEITEETRALAFQGWLRAANDRPLDERHIKASTRLGLNPYARSLRIPLPDTRTARYAQQLFRTSHPSQVEARALSAVTGAAGALTIPEGFVRSLEINMLAFGGVRQVAEQIRTTEGADLPWPTADDTSNTGEQLGESAAVTVSGADPTFGAIILKAYKFSSKGVKIPSELLEDTAFDMAGVLGGMLGERLGRITNTKFTTGTGAATPKGIVEASTAGNTTASATAITADELMDLVHQVDPAYRTQAPGFMMHDSVLLVIRKLKDGNGDYLWQSGLQDGVPDRLLSYPLTINQDMTSAVTAGLKTILFGALNKYKIRTVREIRLFRLEELYRANDQDGFMAFAREDGNLLDAGTAPVKHLLQAT